MTAMQPYQKVVMLFLGIILVKLNMLILILLKVQMG